MPTAEAARLAKPRTPKAPTCAPAGHRALVDRLPHLADAALRRSPLGLRPGLAPSGNGRRRSRQCRWARKITRRGVISPELSHCQVGIRQASCTDLLRGRARAPQHLAGAVEKWPRYLPGRPNSADAMRATGTDGKHVVQHVGPARQTACLRRTAYQWPVYGPSVCHLPDGSHFHITPPRPRTRVPNLEVELAWRLLLAGVSQGGGCGNNAPPPP
jgi:hypothetical protein